MSSEFDTVVKALEWMRDTDTPLVEGQASPPAQVLGAMGLRVLRCVNGRTSWTVIGISTPPGDIELTPTATIVTSKGSPHIVSYNRALSRSMRRSSQSGFSETSMPSDIFYQEWMPWLSQAT